eukprot:SM000116S24258  [mRNA]  locus=s116:317822:320083:- [translate_table: standard]
MLLPTVTSLRCPCRGQAAARAPRRGQQCGEAAISESDPRIAGRRWVVALAAATVALFGFGSGRLNPAKASVSRVVKLKDVDNQELQDALRAAVAGDLQSSESLFDKLVLDNPDSASIWSNRGSVRVQLGKYEAATEDFTRAIQLAPDAPVPYLNRAIAYEALGQFDEAIADCKSAIINDPDEFAAWFNLGNAQSKVKDYPNALKAYERASLLAPGIAGYRLRQALALFQLERPSEAAQLMKGLVRKYPNYAEAHAALAAVLWSSDKQPGAEDEYRQATEQEPNFESIQWVKSRLQWPPKAVSAMEAFLAIK